MTNTQPPAPERSRRDNLVEHARRESQKAREREEQMREIRAMFSKFGHQVMAHVSSQFIRYGHIKNVLGTLGLNQPDELRAQCDLLQQHFKLNGSTGLMQKLNAQATPLALASPADTQKIPPGESDPTPIPEPAPEPTAEPTDDVADQILDEAVTRLMNRVLKKCPPKTPPPIDDVDTQVEDKPSAASTIVDPHSPRHRQQKSKELSTCPITGRPMLNGIYIERRSGQDRRVGGDRRTLGNRRQTVEITYHNKRFGPDRRSSHDRRSGHDRRVSS